MERSDSDQSSPPVVPVSPDESIAPRNGVQTETINRDQLAVATPDRVGSLGYGHPGYIPKESPGQEIVPAQQNQNQKRLTHEEIEELNCNRLQNECTNGGLSATAKRGVPTTRLNNNEARRREEVYRGPPTNTLAGDQIWPEGWVMISKKRLTLEKGGVRLDHYWISPCNQTFRSMKAVEAFLRRKSGAGATNVRRKGVHRESTLMQQSLMGEEEASKDEGVPRESNDKDYDSNQDSKNASSGNNILQNAAGNNIKWDPRSDPNTPGVGVWTKEEKEAFMSGIHMYGKQWEEVAAMVRTRSASLCKARAQKVFGNMQKVQELYESHNAGKVGKGEDESNSDNDCVVVNLTEAHNKQKGSQICRMNHSQLQNECVNAGSSPEGNHNVLRSPLCNYWRESDEAINDTQRVAASTGSDSSQAISSQNNQKRKTVESDEAINDSQRAATSTGSDSSQAISSQNNQKRKTVEQRKSRRATKKPKLYQPGKEDGLGMHQGECSYSSGETSHWWQHYQNNQKRKTVEQRKSSRATNKPKLYQPGKEGGLGMHQGECSYSSGEASHWWQHYLQPRGWKIFHGISQGWCFLPPLLVPFGIKAVKSLGEEGIHYAEGWESLYKMVLLKVWNSKSPSKRKVRKSRTLLQQLQA